MEEQNRYEEFVNELEQELIEADGDLVPFDKNRLLKKINFIHEEEFKEKTIKVFNFQLIDSYDAYNNREKIKSGNRFEFLSMIQYNPSLQQFVNENWKEFDKIIAILQDYILQLEIEETSEEKGETEE